MHLHKRESGAILNELLNYYEVSTGKWVKCQWSRRYGVTKFDVKNYTAELLGDLVAHAPQQAAQLDMPKTAEEAFRLSRLFDYAETGGEALGYLRKVEDAATAAEEAAKAIIQQFDPEQYEEMDPQRVKNLAMEMLFRESSVGRPGKRRTWKDMALYALVLADALQQGWRPVWYTDHPTKKVDCNLLGNSDTEPTTPTAGKFYTASRWAGPSKDLWGPELIVTKQGEFLYRPYGRVGTEHKVNSELFRLC